MKEISISLQCFIAFIFLSLPLSTAPQIAMAAQTSPSLELKIDEFTQNINEQYVQPNPTQLEIFRTALDQLVSGKKSASQKTFAEVGYSIESWEDLDLFPSETLTALVPLADAKMYGLFIIRESPQDPSAYIFEAPHPVDDEGTSHLAAQLFRTLPSRALAISGSSRCASFTKSACAGKTSVCSEEPEAFRISDMAHAPETFFEVFHEVIFGANPSSIVAQIHGFSPDSHLQQFVVSDGSTTERSRDYITNYFASMFTKGLKKAGLASKGVTCNHTPEFIDLCATTNVQGRYVNNGTHTCEPEKTLHSKTASGQFIHIELARHLRVNTNSAGENALAAALTKLFESKK